MPGHGCRDSFDLFREDLVCTPSPEKLQNISLYFFSIPAPAGVSGQNYAEKPAGSTCGASKVLGSSPASQGLSGFIFCSHVKYTRSKSCACSALAAHST